MKTDQEGYCSRRVWAKKKAVMPARAICNPRAAARGWSADHTRWARSCCAASSTRRMVRSGAACVHGKNLHTI